jgi:hypothetical protein
VGFKRREGLEDWRRRNILHAIGKPEGSGKEYRKKAKKILRTTIFPKN